MSRTNAPASRHNAWIHSGHNARGRGVPAPVVPTGILAVHAETGNVLWAFRDFRYACCDGAGFAYIHPSNDPDHIFRVIPTTGQRVDFSPGPLGGGMTPQFGGRRGAYGPIHYIEESGDWKPWPTFPWGDNPFLTYQAVPGAAIDDHTLHGIVSFIGGTPQQSRFSLVGYDLNNTLQTLYRKEYIGVQPPSFYGSTNIQKGIYGCENNLSRGRFARIYSRTGDLIQNMNLQGSLVDSDGTFLTVQTDGWFWIGRKRFNTNGTLTLDWTNHVFENIQFIGGGFGDENRYGISISLPPIPDANGNIFVIAQNLVSINNPLFEVRVICLRSSDLAINWSVGTKRFSIQRGVVGNVNISPYFATQQGQFLGVTGGNVLRYSDGNGGLYIEHVDSSLGFPRWRDIIHVTPQGRGDKRYRLPVLSEPREALWLLDMSKDRSVLYCGFNYPEDIPGNIMEQLP